MWAVMKEKPQFIMSRVLQSIHGMFFFGAYFQHKSKNKSKTLKQVQNK